VHFGYGPLPSVRHGQVHRTPLRTGCDQKFNGAEPEQARAIQIEPGIMKILYLNPHSVIGVSGETILQRGYEVVLTSKRRDALEQMGNQKFDALVIEDAEEDNALLDFTVKVHRMQPATPQFLANEWGPDLLRGLEQFVGPTEVSHR